MGVDAAVTDALTDHRFAWLTNVAKTVTNLGSTTTLVVGGAVVSVWACRRLRSWWPLALAVVGLVGTDLLVRVLKVVVDRSRPPARLALVDAGGGSFPSAHAAHAAALGAFIVAVVWWMAPARDGSAAAARRPVAAGALAMAPVVALVMALVVAWSRVYLGVHWLSDTLAGLAIGWALTGGAAWVMAGIVREGPTAPQPVRRRR